jgi:hypothetical protein
VTTKSVLSTLAALLLACEHAASKKDEPRKFGANENKHKPFASNTVDGMNLLSLQHPSYK